MIPAAFEARKRKILADLSVPDAEYTDLSPKGFVDEGIRDLIHDINALDGLVTTSSCAGRISVFLEGRRKTDKSRGSQRVVSCATTEVSAGEAANRIDDASLANGAAQLPRSKKFASSGGKGAGGCWLYVSHDPVSLDGGKNATSFHELFGVSPGLRRPLETEKHGMRLVRFQFEPMILHIMAATLEHARPVLAAASSAGFRESGLQSLRCLDAAGGHHHQGADASPIVAVRSSGLFLESIIGYTCCPDDDEDDDSIAHDPVSPTAIHCLVTEEYLRLLVSIANERFTTNSERIGRFRTHLLSSFADISPGGTTATTLTTTDAPAKSNGRGIKKTKASNWRQRRELKRDERLLLQEQRKSQHEEEIRRPNLEDEDGDDDIDGLIGDLISL
ncbi:hypothetical protein Egran_00250 [Elaphomyces granulatus]|uniref:tRNA(Phe) 7-[(3-amino-3-carboxypropyl)-4-demethylwyosine(37)-N(4)]-methyltransferase n=1 Tax=Elaphomyces granulatus TaxID=519963 RepID=A0A232M6H5_9EURO|nr:hypothetical protein Egran_00250 [Elaphomyces granulatus]